MMLFLGPYKAGGVRGSQKLNLSIVFRESAEGCIRAQPIILSLLKADAIHKMHIFLSYF